VRISIPQAYDLAVVDLAMPTRDSGEAVEVLGLHGDTQLPPNLSPLWRRCACDIAGDVVLDDCPVETVDDQGALAAGSLRGRDQCQLAAPYHSGCAWRKRLLQQLILEDGG
jgi:hypothetical protein